MSLSQSLVIVLFINILLLGFSSAIGVPTIGDFVVYNLFDRSQIDGGQVTGFDASFEEGIDKEKTAETEIGGFFAFMDGLKKIFSWLINIIGLGFSLFAMLSASGAPLFISLLFGLPFAIFFYVGGIISVIRGFQT